MENRGKSSRTIILIFFSIFLIWFLLQLIAPLWLPTDSVDDLSGLVALEDNEKPIDDILIGMFIDWKIYDDETSNISFPSYGKWTKEELDAAKKTWKRSRNFNTKT